MGEKAAEIAKPAARAGAGPIGSVARSVADPALAPLANLAVHGVNAHLLTGVDYTRIRLSDGAIVQREDLTPLLRPLRIGDVGMPAFLGDAIVAVRSDGIAFAYDPGAHRLVWHVDVGGRCRMRAIRRWRTGSSGSWTTRARSTNSTCQPEATRRQRRA